MSDTVGEDKSFIAPEPDDKVLGELEALGKEVLSSRILTPEEPPHLVGELPPLTYDMRIIMGMSADRCTHIATVFRQTTHPDIPHDTAEEQAFVIHLLLNMYLKSPGGWRIALDTEIKRLKVMLLNKSPEE